MTDLSHEEELRVTAGETEGATSRHNDGRMAGESDGSPDYGDPVDAATHKVRSGDTLASIAKQYDTSVEALKFLNGVSNALLIRVGQELLVRWIVVDGQTLSNVADAYNASRFTRVRTTPSSLATRSNIHKPEHLEAGQMLRLP